MTNSPLMPMATAVWLVENTTLTFKQIAEFCNLHEVEVQGIADGEVAKGIMAYNPKTFDQINIKKNIIGEKGKLLTENLEVDINFYNESPLSVEMPNQVTCKVKNTDVALKGQTVSSSYKPATLDNGINIQVPPFIESEDEIIVDTRTIEYVKKI